MDKEILQKILAEIKAMAEKGMADEYLKESEMEETPDLKSVPPEKVGEYSEDLSLEDEEEKPEMEDLSLPESKEEEDPFSSMKKDFFKKKEKPSEEGAISVMSIKAMAPKGKLKLKK